MTRKHYSFGTLAIVGLLLLLGTFGPWMHRVATEPLSTYRMSLEWSRDSETLGEWGQIHAESRLGEPPVKPGPLNRRGPTSTRA